MYYPPYGSPTAYLKDLFEQAKRTAGAATDHAITACQTASAPIVNTALNVVAVAATLAAPVQTIGALNYLKPSQDPNGIDPPWDGQELRCEKCNGNEDCGINGRKPSTPVPEQHAGKRPSCSNAAAADTRPRCTRTSFEKVYYINGIRTTPAANCKTSRALADTLCAEVVSIYNRTEGVPGDVRECVGNMMRIKKLPATDAMVGVMKGHFQGQSKPYKPLHLCAHRQGGLITQQALIEFKAELRTTHSEKEVAEIMGSIHVKSFGTAAYGWPQGPVYEQFVNEYDPVPKVIFAAQTQLIIQTLNQGDLAALREDQIHKVSIPHNNPASSHDMDVIYLKQLQAVEAKRGPSFSSAGCIRQAQIQAAP